MSAALKISEVIYFIMKLFSSGAIICYAESLQLGKMILLNVKDTKLI